MGMTYFSVLLRALPQSHTSKHQMDPAPKCEVFFIAFLGAYCQVISFMQFTQSYLVMESLYTSEVSLVLVEFFRFLCSWKIHCAEKKSEKAMQSNFPEDFKRTNDHEVSFITKTYKTHQCLDLQLATIIIFIMSVSVHYVKVQRSVVPFKSNTESLSHSSGDFFFVCIILLLNQFLENGEKRKRSYENFNSSNYKGKGKRQPSWTWR